MANQKHASDKATFEREISLLQAELANVAASLNLDEAARREYMRRIQQVSIDFNARVANGTLTWAEAADQASEMRNAVMDTLRKRSTPVGRSIAEKMKQKGKTLNQLVAEKTQKLFGETADFTKLSTADKNKVYAEIVKSSGKPNPKLTRLLPKLSIAGRALLVLSIGVSVYNVATAEDREDAIKKELATAGAGIGGGIAGGAVAGLACGPGAPVCVTVGAFVGGALAALGVDFLW